MKQERHPQTRANQTARAELASSLETMTPLMAALSEAERDEELERERLIITDPVGEAFAGWQRALRIARETEGR